MSTSAFLKDPTVTHASVDFLSHRCSKEFQAAQTAISKAGGNPVNKNDLAPLDECRERELRSLNNTCHKELAFVTECLEDFQRNESAGFNHCRRAYFQLRTCVRANYGFDPALESRKSLARLQRTPVPTSLPDSEKLEAAAKSWQ